MNFYKLLFTIALPIIIQNFFSSFVNVLDTVMVGQLGAVEIAAVGLGNQIFFVMNTVMFGIASGGSIFVAQFWGRRDMKSLKETLGIMITISMIVTLFFASMAGFFPEVCLSIYTKDPAVIAKGAEYLRPVSISYLFIGAGFAWAHAERSTEHVKVPMIATGISVVLNGILNFIFIFGVNISGKQIVPVMGIRGAAIATVISRFAETAILISVPFIKKYEIVGVFKDYLLHYAGFLKKYLKITLPVLINESLWSFGISMQNSIFAHAGTDIIAAFNIRGVIDNLVWVYFIGTGNAAAIIIGKKIGETKYDEARTLAKRMARFMFLSGVGLSLLMIPLSFTLKYFFNVDSEIIKMAMNMLYIIIPFYPFCALDMCMVVGVCRSGGDTVYAALMDVGFMWLISLPLGALGVHLGWSYWILFICIHIEDILKAIAGLLRLHSGKWLHNVTIS